MAFMTGGKGGGPQYWREEVVPTGGLDEIDVLFVGYLSNFIACSITISFYYLDCWITLDLVSYLLNTLSYAQGSIANTLHTHIALSLHAI